VHIAQIVLPGASEYERKCQRADRAALSEGHTIVTDPHEAEVAHVYGPRELPAATFAKFPVPYVANGTIPTTRWSWRKPRQPGFVVSPVGERPLPEPVEAAYLERIERVPHQNVTIGTYRRKAIMNAVQQTMARIQRFRDDVTWNLFERVPTPADLAGVDLWVDPAVDDDDFDGFVAEALVIGVPVVASRTAINLHRTEKGRTGFLVPRNDPNEATHAILSALFKPEGAQQKLVAARQTASKFHAKQRLRVLLHMYETLIR
jgi:hypothetical protein